MGYTNGELFRQLRKLAEDPEFNLTQKQITQLLFAGMAGLREHIDEVTKGTSEALQELKVSMELNAKEHVEIRTKLVPLDWIKKHPKLVISGIIVLCIFFGIVGGSFWHVPEVREFFIERVLSAL